MNTIKNYLINESSSKIQRAVNLLSSEIDDNYPDTDVPIWDFLDSLTDNGTDYVTMRELASYCEEHKNDY